jgi:hypothetical protein
MSRAPTPPIRTCRRNSPGETPGGLWLARRRSPEGRERKVIADSYLAKDTPAFEEAPTVCIDSVAQLAHLSSAGTGRSEEYLHRLQAQAEGQSPEEDKDLAQG